MGWGGSPCSRVSLVPNISEYGENIVMTLLDNGADKTKKEYGL